MKSKFLFPLSLLLALLVLPSQTLAQDPQPQPKAVASQLGLSQALPDVWPTGRHLTLSPSSSTFANKARSAAWITPAEIEATSIPTPAGPILVLSSQKQCSVVIYLVVTLEDTIDVAKITLLFGSDAPDPEPGPQPQPRPSVTLPPLPSSLAIAVAPIFKQVAAEATSIEDLQTQTTVKVTAALGVQRFVSEFVPWRDKFTALVNDQKPKDLADFKKYWEMVK